MRGPKAVTVSTYKGVPYIRKRADRGRRVFSELQQAWVDRFTCTAQQTKNPSPRDYDTANKYKRDDFPSNYRYWRDWIAVCFVNKLIVVNDEVRMTTPTALVRRTTAQTTTAGAWLTLLPNAYSWDTNTFWNSAVNPSRLTVKSSGLYLLGGSINYPGSTPRQHYVRILKNGTTNVVFASGTNVSGEACDVSIFTPVYAQQNDYFEILTLISGVAKNATLHDFYMVAITPESITVN